MIFIYVKGKSLKVNDRIVVYPVFSDASKVYIEENPNKVLSPISYFFRVKSFHQIEEFEKQQKLIREFEASIQ